MRRIGLVLFVVFLAEFFVAYTCNASSIPNAPHGDTHNITCASCHIDPLPETDRSDVCGICHGAGGTAPLVLTHSNAVINGSSGWSTSCLDCHDPHFHNQLVNISDLYLITGTIDAYSNNGNGSSTFTFDYSTAVIKAGWNLPPHLEN